MPDDITPYVIVETHDPDSAYHYKIVSRDGEPLAYYANLNYALEQLQFYNQQGLMPSGIVSRTLVSFHLYYHYARKERKRNILRAIGWSAREVLFDHSERAFDLYYRYLQWRGRVPRSN